MFELFLFILAKTVTVTGKKAIQNYISIKTSVFNLFQGKQHTTCQEYTTISTTVQLLTTLKLYFNFTVINLIFISKLQSIRVENVN